MAPRIAPPLRRVARNAHTCRGGPTVEPAMEMRAAFRPSPGPIYMAAIRWSRWAQPLGSFFSFYGFSAGHRPAKRLGLNSGD